MTNLSDRREPVKRDAILPVLVSVQQPSVPAGDNPLRRLRWLFWGVALLVGVLAGLLIGVLHSSPTTPAIPTAIPPAGPASR